MNTSAVRDRIAVLTARIDSLSVQDPLPVQELLATLIERSLLCRRIGHIFVHALGVRVCARCSRKAVDTDIASGIDTRLARNLYGLSHSSED
jgi:hypothetical protein